MTQKTQHVLLIHLSFLLFLFFSCVGTPENTKDNADSLPKAITPRKNIDTLIILNAEQQSAFDALNSIQRQGEHLYSTFAGIYHACTPNDTTIMLSQAELLTVITALLDRYCAHIDQDERSRLASLAVLAQSEYQVVQCGDCTYNSDQGNTMIPDSGTWILPEVLGKRDVVIEW